MRRIRESMIGERSGRPAGKTKLVPVQITITKHGDDPSEDFTVELDPKTWENDVYELGKKIREIAFEMEPGF